MFFDTKLRFWNNYNCENEHKRYLHSDYIYLLEVKSFKYEKIKICLN